MQLITPEQTQYKADWRIVFGIGFSLLWLMCLVLFSRQQLSWQAFLQLPLDQIGSFLGGAFSPLAFLWLVIGFFIQQGEIYQNTRNIELQAQHTNLDNFLKMSELVYQQMSVSMGFLYVSCRSEIEAETGQPLSQEEKWSRASNGDRGVFARALLAIQFDDQGNERSMTDIFYGTQIRQRHTGSYCDVFERLLTNAGLCDATGSLRDALVNGTEWGILYKTMLATKAESDIAQNQT